jgi:hypothetical protein
MSLGVSLRVAAPSSTPTTSRWEPGLVGHVDLNSPVSGYIYPGSAVAAEQELSFLPAAG